MIKFFILPTFLMIYSLTLHVITILIFKISKYNDIKTVILHHKMLVNTILCNTYLHNIKNYK